LYSWQPQMLLRRTRQKMQMTRLTSAMSTSVSLFVRSKSCGTLGKGRVAKFDTPEYTKYQEIEANVSTSYSANLYFKSRSEAIRVVNWLPHPKTFGKVRTEEKHSGTKVMGISHSNLSPIS
jgi:hypothetical protein